MNCTPEFALGAPDSILGTFSPEVIGRNSMAEVVITPDRVHALPLAMRKMII